MSDIDTIRQAHNDFVSSHPCSPELCDTRVVLDTLDRALVAAEGLADADKRHRADADRLAEALRETGECWCPAADDPMRDHKCIRCEALRQREEQR